MRLLVNLSRDESRRRPGNYQVSCLHPPVTTGFLLNDHYDPTLQPLHNEALTLSRWDNLGIGVLAVVNLKFAARGLGPGRFAKLNIASIAGFGIGGTDYRLAVTVDIPAIHSEGI